jgi:hypothetical protein
LWAEATVLLRRHRVRKEEKRRYFTKIVKRLSSQKYMA